MPILKRQVNSSSNFASFFIFMTHNSSVNFKLIYFLLCIKGSYHSLNFETSKRSGENLSYSSFHFPNHKSVFHQLLYHSSVSWKITLLYYFRLNVMCFAQKQLNKSKSFENFECSDQNSPNSCHFWNNKSAFFNLVNFHAINRKFAIWWAPFVQSIYCLSKRIQWSYVSWHWRVMQYLKKNWLVFWKMT